METISNNDTPSVIRRKFHALNIVKSERETRTREKECANDVQTCISINSLNYQRNFNRKFPNLEFASYAVVTVQTCVTRQLVNIRVAIGVVNSPSQSSIIKFSINENCKCQLSFGNQKEKFTLQMPRNENGKT